MSKIRIGVIGLGFGRHHVRTLANMPDAQLVAVADRSPDLPGGLEGFAAAYGAAAYRDALAAAASLTYQSCPFAASSVASAP